MAPNFFENSAPILNVASMNASLKYYVEVLGFKSADWGSADFTCLTRDRAAIYLCQGAQGGKGTWLWVGVQDAGNLYEEYKAKGAKLLGPPENFPWAYEFRVEDPDGHVLRFGSEPRTDLPLKS